MPVFYHDVMYRENTEEKDAAFLKLYDGHDWKWFAVRLKHTDMEYLRKHWSGKKASAPMLEKKHDKYFLRFTYAEEVALNRTPVKEQTDLQCGSRHQYGCSLYHHASRRNYPGEKVY